MMLRGFMKYFVNQLEYESDTVNPSNSEQSPTHVETIDGLEHFLFRLILVLRRAVAKSPHVEW